MSHKPSWHTKEDIMQDLVVMGQMTNIDEGYLVTGEKPPPPRLELDDEMDLLFGPSSDDGYPYHTEQPDLQGITQFLRMVNDEDSHPVGLPDDEITIVKPSFSKRGPKVALSDNGIEVVGGTRNHVPIVILSDEEIKKDKRGLNSRLDPTVAEFIPKSVHNGVVCDNNSDNDMIKPNGVNVGGDIKMSTLNNKIDVTSLNQKEKDDITAKLRDKISDSLRADTPQLKKERNVAIANLMKLHTTPARPSTSDTELHTDTDNTIKLCTPDYYKRCAKFSPTSNTQRSTPNKDLKKTRMSESNRATPEPELNSSNIEPVLNSNCGAPEQDISISLNSSMEESIKKVNKWLEQPESPQPKAPAVCLGPISFKKKDSNNAKSPTNDIEHKRSPSTAVYRPSQYADDLGKKYVERSKIKEAQSLDMWTRLEKELKARDKKIKMKQETSGRAQ